MSLAAWSLRQLGLFWVAAASTSALCLIVGRLRNAAPWEFAYVLPYDGTLQSIFRTAAMIVRQAFVERPWEVMALVGVPIVAVAVSLGWVAARVLARRAG